MSRLWGWVTKMSFLTAVTNSECLGVFSRLRKWAVCESSDCPTFSWIRVTVSATKSHAMFKISQKAFSKTRAHLFRIEFGAPTSTSWSVEPQEIDSLKLVQKYIPKIFFVYSGHPRNVYYDLTNMPQDAEYQLPFASTSPLLPPPSSPSSPCCTIFF